VDDLHVRDDGFRRLRAYASMRLMVEDSNQQRSSHLTVLTLGLIVSLHC
jgi:hypothetical protein